MICTIWYIELLKVIHPTLSATGSKCSCVFLFKSQQGLTGASCLVVTFSDQGYHSSGHLLRLPRRYQDGLGRLLCQRRFCAPNPLVARRDQQHGGRDLGPYRVQVVHPSVLVSLFKHRV